MKDFMLWWSSVGTDFWFEGVWANNKYLLLAIAGIGGAFIKGRWPTFLDNLKTIVPFVGNPKKF